jgi:hypothetical protein
MTDAPTNPFFDPDLKQELFWRNIPIDDKIAYNFLIVQPSKAKAIMLENGNYYFRFLCQSLDDYPGINLFKLEKFFLQIPQPSLKIALSRHPKSTRFIADPMNDIIFKFKRLSQKRLDVIDVKAIPHLEFNESPEVEK